MITIYPDKGNETFVAQMLLSLVDNPNDVQPVSRPTVGFRVSDEVYERFVQMTSSAEESEPEVVKPVKKAKKAVPKVEEDQ
jgi:hypothetical protein